MNLAISQANLRVKEREREDIFRRRLFCSLIEEKNLTIYYVVLTQKN